jgi:hypothetical protein
MVQNIFHLIFEGDGWKNVPVVINQLFERAKIKTSDRS